LWAESPITPSGLHTQVSDPIIIGPNTQYNITGGTRPGGLSGTNLFHSFGDFNVPTNDIANFLNAGSVDLAGNPLAAGLPTSNILGTVTDVNPSIIFGTIQTNGTGGFGNANLFLMNPHGFLFGPNATVNVGGMVSFTTANYLRLAETGIFYADPAATSVLTSAPVAAFGFLGSNPAAISVQGSTLAVQPGQSIALVGGNQGFTYTNPDTDAHSTVPVPDGVTVTDGHLLAPGGQANIASVASPGEILTGTLAQAPNINGQSFGNLGAIQVLEQSVIDVSGNGGGTVLIRGGQFLLDNSTTSANVTGPGPIIAGVESIGRGIDIVVSQDVVIQNGAILETTVSGNASSIVKYSGVSVKADRIEILGSQDFENSPVTGIFSNVLQDSTGGSSGDIKLEANSILVREFGTFTTFLETATDGAGNSGNITLQTSGNLELDGVVFVNTFSLDSASGNAGNIELTSTQGNILITNGPFVSSQSGALGRGRVGSIAVNAPVGDILLTASVEFGPAATLFTAINGTEGGPGIGGIQLTAKNLTIENSGIQIDNFAPSQPGDLTVNLTGTLSMSGADIPSTLLTTTRRSAQSADLNITAPDILLADGSRVSTETYRDGNGGTLNIFTQHLELTSGAQITSGSIFNPNLFPGDPPETPSGAGGTITIQGLQSPAESVLIDGTDSGIFTNTEGTGAGGNVSVSATSVTLQNGGTISAATSGTAPTATGGSIVINATEDVTLTNSSSVTASSTGPGNTGNIQIDAGNQFVMANSSVTTEANQASGGTIKITTTPSGTVELTNSTISASVLDGTGGGGSVDIDPQYVLLQNSQILARATEGPGGNITITITNGGLFLPDANSVVSASSGNPALNGTVTIQSPNAPASGQIQPLGQSPLLATSLLNQHCAALAGGEFSSFTVAGRDSLPTEPGSWLASPLAMLNAGMERGVKAEGGKAEGEILEMPVLSLRQIAPAGFLTQAFAVEGLTSCQS
jgi:filamentous hemagglutinin family protein